MPPPRFSAASADRLDRVVETADAAVDAGETPDRAIAKAAQDFGLPVGHVPLAVQAFNTGRAVGQLAAADPWEKAAAYPQATAGGVMEVLGAAPTTKAAADLTDYALPPGCPGPTPAPKLPARPVEAVKVASIPRAAADNTLHTLFAAATEMDALTGFALGARPGEYAAVKAAAVAAHPEAAAFAFGRIEAEHPRVREKKAAARPDPATRTGGHPALENVARLAALKTAAVVADPTPPSGWVKGAADGWLRRGPHNTLLGLPVPPAAPPSPPAPEPPPLLAAQPAAKAASFASAFTQTAAAPMRMALNSNTFGPVFRLGGGSPGLSTKQDDALMAGMRQTDEQAAIQGLLADQRFRHADPKTVVETFRQLHSLAPQAMANPAVAGDFVQRRLQTGPLSAYDLKLVVDLEKGLAQARRNSAVPDDDAE